MSLSPSDRRLILGHQAAVRAIRASVTTYAATAWKGLGSYRDRDIDRLVQIVTPRVLAGQRQVAGLTDAYLAAVSGRRALGVDPKLVTGAAVRGGAAPTDVYRRPGSAVYAALAAGKTYPKAVTAGARRLQSLVSTDMQLAFRQQADISMQTSGFSRYGRVLTGAEDCALCVITSTQAYSTGDLLPLHPGCDCGVAPLEDGAEPGQVLDPELLGTLHAAVETQVGRFDSAGRDIGLGTGRDYTELIVSRDHGEYGPTLTWRSDHFAGPGDIAA